MLANVIVHWPGKDTPACFTHAEKLVALGSHMGLSVSVTPISNPDSTVTCSNCEREKKPTL